MGPFARALRWALAASHSVAKKLPGRDGLADACGLSRGAPSGVAFFPSERRLGRSDLRWMCRALSMGLHVMNLVLPVRASRVEGNIRCPYDPLPTWIAQSAR